MTHTRNPGPFDGRALARAPGAVALCAIVLAGCGGGAGDAAGGSDGEAATAFVPPMDTDILVAPITWSADGTPSVGAPANLTQRPDYDNQPHFVPDGSGLWYTVNDPHAGQADIWRYDFASASVTAVTMSNPESEYSATALPDGSGISTIRVEADSTQRLWRFDADGSDAAVLLEDVAPVGYHAWVDESTVVMFVLGSPPTLQRGDLRTGVAELIATDIGRSIQAMPGSGDVSWVQRLEEGRTVIMRLPADGNPPAPIIEGIDGGDDHAWAPNGTLFQASGAVLYAARPDQGLEWTPVADFGALNITLSRLAVSPDGSQIAMVAELAPFEPASGN